MAKTKMLKADTKTIRGCSSPRISIPFESASLYRAVPERLLKEDPVTC